MKADRSAASCGDAQPQCLACRHFSIYKQNKKFVRCIKSLHKQDNRMHVTHERTIGQEQYVALLSQPHRDWCSLRQFDRDNLLQVIGMKTNKVNHQRRTIHPCRPACFLPPRISSKQTNNKFHIYNNHNHNKNRLTSCMGEKWLFWSIFHSPNGWTSANALLQHVQITTFLRICIYLFLNWIVSPLQQQR
jgi:hypothetical protein